MINRSRTALNGYFFILGAVTDQLLILLSIIFSVLIRFGNIDSLRHTPVLGMWIFYAAISIIGSQVESLFVVRTGVNRTLHAYRLIRVALLTTFLYVVFVYALKFPAALLIVSRMVILLVFLIWISLSLLIRVILFPRFYAFLLKLFGIKKLRILLCGEPKAIRNVKSLLNKSPIYRQIFDIIPGKCYLEGSEKNRLNYYLEEIKKKNADQICLIDRKSNINNIAEFCLECSERDIPLCYFSPRFLELRYYDPWLSTAETGAMPFFSRKWSKTQEILWRIVDFLVSMVSILVILPVLLVVALAIKLTSKGSIFFKQYRTGKDLTVFNFIKFRSMTAQSTENIEAHKEYFRKYAEGKASQDNEEQKDNGNGAIYKLDQQSRITTVGRIIRKTSIDELPQLFSVLTGKMSLVGPRPSIPYELEHYKKWQLERYYVKPGLTGVWQVYGRSRLPFDDAQFLDFCFVLQRSFVLNTRLIIKTFPVVLFGRGGL